MQTQESLPPPSLEPTSETANAINVVIRRNLRSNTRLDLVNQVQPTQTSQQPQLTQTSQQPQQTQTQKSQKPQRGRPPKNKKALEFDNN